MDATHEMRFGHATTAAQHRGLITAEGITPPQAGQSTPIVRPNHHLRQTKSLLVSSAQFKHLLTQLTMIGGGRLPGNRMFVNMERPREDIHTKKRLNLSISRK